MDFIRESILDVLDVYSLENKADCALTPETVDFY